MVRAAHALPCAPSDRLFAGSLVTPCFGASMACMIARSASSRAAAATARQPLQPLRVAAVRPCVPARSPCPRTRVLVRAAGEAEDFDAWLAKNAERWEKADNKPVLVAYFAAAFGALFTAEWLIHLPALDFLLGFPVQLLGLFTIPLLVVRWGMDGVKPGDDMEKYTAAIIDKLPGLKK